MYEPDPAAQFIHQVSAGYSLPQTLPEYTFDETPLRLTDRRGRGGGYGGLGGPGAGGAAGRAAAGSLLYSPIFSTPASANNAAVGPASSAAGHFNFHTTSATTASALTSSVPATTHHRSSPPHFAIGKMEPTPEDLVAQEAAAREYQPQLEGPFVGEKTPSTAIANEYAKADPIYIQKTAVLPQTYSHYRPIQGDGNCGWRAIAFGYFETLVNGGNKDQIVAERLRLEGLNSYIETQGGHSSYVYTDFVEETLFLLDRVAALIGNHEQAMAEVYSSFNDPEIANAIMYHFRLLASSYLKGNQGSYAAFVTHEGGVDGYCSSTLERHHVEIDQIGLLLLVNVLLKPVGFVLQVAYLDRSPGSEVNSYRFPEEARNQHPSTLGPMIHLLYRPDHYDLLYPAEPEPIPEPVTVQVHRVSFSPSYDIASAPVPMHSYGINIGALAMLPGFGAPPPGLAPTLLDTSPSPLSAYSPSPTSTWMTSPFAEPPQQASPVSVPPVPVPMSMPIHTAPAVAPAPPLQTHPLRFSEYCQLPEYVENDTWREPSFQTSTFRNSHFNVAHYNNPNFQPEEYRPETEDYDAPQRGSGKKRASV
ncbi:peptidase C65 Otubain-domain-containing protein [Apiosordaria backusii]|uniref:ubiquitinyl hydrolase 1 n=1 Tax=Apiosordaria backusii TaxID=314023 RepID=A0AA40BNF5_9PEZI|nr:peptidase C65 Otubain-domain-containing protein [Apiosordaria backusii]